MAEKKIKINDIPHYTESILYEMLLTARVMRLHGDQLFVKMNQGLTRDEYATLDVIMCNPNICQRDLAKLLLKDRANTGKMLSVLEEKGYIERTIDLKKNRMVKSVRISDAGCEKLCQINNLILDNLKELIKVFPCEEVETIRVMLKKIRTQLEGQIENKI